MFKHVEEIQDSKSVVTDKISNGMKHRFTVERYDVKDASEYLIIAFSLQYECVYNRISENNVIPG
jgi:hypothetical protein